MNLTYTNRDFDRFLSDIYFPEISINGGGMHINDMFSFYFLLNKLKPTTVIESGGWNGYSTKLIRRTLGDTCKIFFLDPRSIPEDGFRDANPNTTYFMGESFIDFCDLNIDSLDKEKTLCFFDDHQNAAQRLKQCLQKGLKHIFFNDNFPLDAGSHYTIQHLINNDSRKIFDLENQYPYSINIFPQIDLGERDELIKHIELNLIFPNSFPTKIPVDGEEFECTSFFQDTDIDAFEKYDLFFYDRKNYTWNTYIRLI
jgi:hypothetical protein